MPPENSTGHHPEIQLKQGQAAYGKGESVVRRGIRAVFIGPERSGKTAQAEKVATKYCVCHILPKTLFRKEIESNSELGQQIHDYVRREKDIPDNIMLKLIERELDSPACRTGFLIDGYPRGIEEAQKLDSLLQNRQTPLDTVLEFGGGHKWMFEGVLAPRNQVGKHYAKLGRLEAVDATKSFSQVTSKIDEVFSKYVKDNQGGLYYA